MMIWLVWTAHHRAKSWSRGEIASRIGDNPSGDCLSKMWTRSDWSANSWRRNSWMSSSWRDRQR